MHLESFRNAYQPKRPPVLHAQTHFEEAACPLMRESQIRNIFRQLSGNPLIELKEGADPSEAKPVRLGVVLSGGPAPGGHNVIAGIFDGLQERAPGSSLLGFRGGPAGILNDDALELDAATIQPFRNTGGFNLLASGRTKLESEAQFKTALEVARRRELDGLIIVGGDDSNTNACLLAEYAAETNENFTVVGVPKTIDGDLRATMVEMSFGFDTATKVYSELVGNIHRDILSSRKYWHFVRLMGRAASHVALEVALQTQANVSLISEEIQAHNWTLDDVVKAITDSIIQRAADGKNYGSVIIPEGLLEFIPEFQTLISEINVVMANHGKQLAGLQTFRHRREFLTSLITPESAGLFTHLPIGIAAQLLLERDPHGNVQVAKIATDELLVEMVTHQLGLAEQEGRYNGKFSAVTHYFGYEGRCAAPSNFDADYGYSLGYTAALLATNRYTGYIAAVRRIAGPVAGWQPVGVPLPSLMTREQRKGQWVPVIRKCLVDIEGPVFGLLKQNRERWAIVDEYASPGPLQYFGPPEIADRISETLRLESPVT